MSDNKEDKPVLGRKPLGLKRTVEAGQVQQSFSHGRKNTVVVEVKRRRIIGKPGEGEAPAPLAPEPAPPPPPVAVQPARPAMTPIAPRQSAADSLMSRQEMQARLLREAEESRLASQEEARRREEAERLAASEEEKRHAEEAQ
jgi:translation initiation factor IF-2